MISVETSQFGVDSDGLFEDTGEVPPFDRQVEARDVAARVSAAARLGAARDEDAVSRREPGQVTLRTAPAAAGARPQRLRSYDSSSAATSATSATVSGPSTSDSSGR